MGKLKMQGPEGFSAGFIEGHSYEADEKGQVEVAQESHVPTLRRHGFTDVVESSETADEIKAMDREALEEYVEERGGIVSEGIKLKALKAQALRMGGYVEEAAELAPPETAPETDGKKSKKGKKR